MNPLRPRPARASADPAGLFSVWSRVNRSLPRDLFVGGARPTRGRAVLLRARRLETVQLRALGRSIRASSTFHRYEPRRLQAAVQTDNSAAPPGSSPPSAIICLGLSTGTCRAAFNAAAQMDNSTAPPVGPPPSALIPVQAPIELPDACTAELLTGQFIEMALPFSPAFWAG